MTTYPRGGLPPRGADGARVDAWLAATPLGVETEAQRDLVDRIVDRTPRLRRLRDAHLGRRGRARAYLRHAATRSGDANGRLRFRFHDPQGSKIHSLLMVDEIWHLDNRARTFLDDMTRWVVADFVCAGPDWRVVLDLLEGHYGVLDAGEPGNPATHDASVAALIDVAFLRNLPSATEAGGAVRDALGPELRAGLGRVESDLAGA